jgi:hypothetical protein
MYQFKKFSGGYTAGPPFRREVEGRQKGGIRRNGRKAMGRKDEGGGERREGK